MLKKTDWLIIKSYIGPLLATFFVCVFLLLMQFLWRYIDDLVGKGLEWSIIAELLMYASAQLVPMALPLAILLAAIMTFGNMGEHNELMAMKAAGISLPRIMRPLIALNLSIAIAAFFFSNYLLPYTNLKMGALLYDIRQQRPELNIQEGVFYEGISGINIKISKKNYENNMLYGIMIYDHRGHSGNLNLTVADSGSIAMSENKQYLVFTLHKGVTYEDVRDRSMYDPRKKSYPFKQQDFEQQQVFIELVGYDFSRTSSDLFKNNYQMLNLSQLGFTEDSLKQRCTEKQKQMIERYLTNSVYLSLPGSKTDSTYHLNTDSIFNAFPAQKKLRAYDYALDYSRSAQKRVTNMQKTIFNKREWIRKHQIEWHKKITLSFACILLFFIGGPFGAIVRKGGLGMPILISILFFLFYYIITMIGEKNVKIGDMIPAYGSWMPSMILLFMGIYLTRRAAKDSVIINIGRYFYFITKYFISNTSLQDRFGKGYKCTKDSAQILSDLNTLTDLLSNYAQLIERSSLKRVISLGTYRYPESSDYMEIYKQYYSFISEYINCPDTEHLFIKEQLLAIPKLKQRDSKFIKVLYITATVLLAGIPVIIIGFIRHRALKRKIVKIKSHLLTIMSYKEKRGL